MTPVAAQMRLPPGYGKPTATLDWQPVQRRLERAERYWLATTRPDGRPHVVPVDGIWLDDLWYFGGAPQAVHQRNLRHNRHVAVNLEDTVAAVIVEGEAEFVTPEPDLAQRLATASRAKYPAYGATADAYAGGVWRLRPSVVLAWDRLHVDATRFTFRPTSR
jgi:nitroimidazol reductase NimA-like FMN-containing flavoprotein (pyridoxamine 5'-phosphate oxidase superfamily)